MSEINEITQSRNQLKLFGYDDYFNSFVKLNKKKALPNNILISGQKGLGKATFAYHIINYLLSKGETEEYNINSHYINIENSSYKLLKANTHPNFFLVDNDFFEKEIKIEKIRNLIGFLNKTVYSKNFKIVLIDNAEYLKIIEEPHRNTIFFLIHNNMIKIPDTLRSRFNEFKIFFSREEKKIILKNIINDYNFDYNNDFFYDNLCFDTPGNSLKYLFLFKEKNIDPKVNLLSSILFLIEKYQTDRNPELIFFLSYFIQSHYLELYKKNKNNLSKILYEQSSILTLLNSIKKYNLNEKNVFIYIKNKLINEKT